MIAFYRVQIFSTNFSTNFYSNVKQFLITNVAFFEKVESFKLFYTNGFRATNGIVKRM